MLDPHSESDVSHCDQSDSNMSDTDLYDEEEEPVTFHQRVYKLGQLMDRGIQYNTDQHLWA